LLLAVTTERKWEPWILYMLKAVEETAAWTTDKINAIKTLQEATAEKIKVMCRRSIATNLWKYCSPNPIAG
jgi:hypothetical protein